MRKSVRMVVAFIVTGCAVAGIYGQQSVGTEVDESLYVRGLLAGLREMTIRWGEIDDSDMGARVRSDWHNVIVEKDPELAEELPSILGEYSIQYLNRRELIDRYKKLRKEFSIIIMHPMKNEGKRLTVWFSIGWFKYKKRSIHYAFSDWCSVYFRYDCTAQEYVVDEVKLGGI
jgi:hypothetical protein